MDSGQKVGKWGNHCCSSAPCWERAGLLCPGEQRTAQAAGQQLQKDQTPWGPFISGLWVPGVHFVPFGDSKYPEIPPWAEGAMNSSQASEGQQGPELGVTAQDSLRTLMSPGPALLGGGGHG
jgi:hypothetical protein